MGRKLIAGACAVSLALGAAAPAYAFDCVVAKKPASAGSVGSVDATGAFTPSKPNPGTEDKPHGGFIEFGGTSTLLHAPDGVLPPTREGGAQFNCDGKGLDALEACE